MHLIYQEKVILQNETGLHARPAGELAKLASTFKSDVNLTVNGKTISAKSILAIMSLGAADVPRGRDSTASEVEFILKATEAETVIVENKDQLKKVLSVRKSLTVLKNLIVLDDELIVEVDDIAKENDVNIYFYKELIEKFKRSEEV